MENRHIDMKFDEKNGISGIIWLLGWALLLGGIIGSLICGKVFETGYDEYNWMVAILGSVGSVIMAFTMFGFSYIVDYLEIIAVNALNNKSTDSDETIDDDEIDETAMDDETFENSEELFENYYEDKT